MSSLLSLVAAAAFGEQTRLKEMFGGTYWGSDKANQEFLKGSLSWPWWVCFRVETWNGLGGSLAVAVSPSSLADRNWELRD